MFKAQNKLVQQFLHQKLCINRNTNVVSLIPGLSCKDRERTKH